MIIIYRCLTCNSEFSEDEMYIYKELHELWGRIEFEYFACCPYCKGAEKGFEFIKGSEEEEE